MPLACILIKQPCERQFREIPPPFIHKKYFKSKTQIMNSIQSSLEGNACNVFGTVSSLGDEVLVEAIVGHNGYNENYTM